MQTEMSVAKNVGSFQELTELGAKNAFTFGNKDWGNMSLISNPGAAGNYAKVFDEIGHKGREFIYLRSEYNDNVQILTDKNLPLYHYNQGEIISEEVGLRTIMIQSDGIITKQPIPIIMAVGDCAIVVVTGKDRNDNKPFIAYIHSGFQGTYLNITTKTIKTILNNYRVSAYELSAFIFPYIHGQQYTKKRGHELLESALQEPSWNDFLVESYGVVEIHFGKKIMAELTNLGITNIRESGLNTYEEHQKGNLFSATYEKDKGVDEGARFAVIASL
ncbi:laccase domain-containing protein [candidate division WWE3 bacterium]|uniref:Laccase domain-containing protein n=1 Tax=candidate division WWE3 bacterium TaxID=2053526 RepID=A0A955LJP2_UNCKA|nr:laccase domain-containing protein [candidate division WWE3 bacterium]